MAQSTGPRHATERARGGIGRWVPLGAVALAGLLIGFPLLGTARATDAVVLRLTLSVPSPVELGPSAQTGTVTIVNRSTGLRTVTLSEISIAPACSDPQCGQVDPDVFDLARSATGAGGACTGQSFAVVGPDSDGRYVLRPPTPVVLGATGSGTSCVIRYGFYVAKLPASDATSATGIQTYQAAQVAAVGQTSKGRSLSGTASQATTITVSKATPILTNVASDSVAVGSSISHAVTLTDGFAPAGALVFALFGPADPTCSGAPLSTWTVPVSNNGHYSSPGYPATTPGTYRFAVSYGGDPRNSTASTSCGDSGAAVAVTVATATISAHASLPVLVGGVISDTAILAGGYALGGTVTFRLYGPSDPSCQSAPLFTATRPVTGPGAYYSGNYSATLVGTYRFAVSYSGDDTNAGVTGSCTSATQSVSVGPAHPTLTGSAARSVPVGGGIFGSATLTGGLRPTGTITFHVFGPDDGTCSAPAAFTSVHRVADAGSYRAESFTPDTAGTYRYVVAYSGDRQNAPVATLCNQPGTAVTVTQLAPTVSGKPSGRAFVGGAVWDDVTVSGALAPSGRLTFALYGPGDAQCARPLSTETVPVSGRTDYRSPSYTPAVAGTYRYVVSYSGDANNQPATTSCSDRSQAIVVSPATTFDMPSGSGQAPAAPAPSTHASAPPKPGESAQASARANIGAPVASRSGARRLAAWALALLAAGWIAVLSARRWAGRTPRGAHAFIPQQRSPAPGEAMAPRRERERSSG